VSSGMLNLDTQALIYVLTDDLMHRERALLSNHTWSISAIILWEIAKLSELGRIELDLDHPELARTLTRIDTSPLTLDTCRSVKALDFDSDPAHETSQPRASCIEYLCSPAKNAPLQARADRFRGTGDGTPE
jgi:PIN domain nuclease of toxin-antitoxin system